MRRSTVMWAGFAAVVGGLSLAACSSESSGNGAASDGPDADTSTDSGAVMADTGSPTAADTGTPVVDAGAPADAGAADATVPADAGPADAGPADATVPDATFPDAGPPDTGVRDAAVDAGPVCRSATDIIERACGACGKQSALCENTDAGVTMGAFSYCFGERDGGCAPGTEPDGGVPCGRCGRARSVCQSDCTYASGSCIEPATSVCTPGEKTFKLGLSCPNPGEGRYATCGSACTFAFGDCIIEETWITAPVTIGATASRAMAITSGKTIGRGASSGTTCTASSTATPYETIVVRNPSAQNLSVSIWNSFGPGASSYYDTVMNVFAGETLPATRGACLGANDTCSTSPCLTSSGLGGFPTSSAITLNAGQSLLVYTGCWSSSCATPTNLVLNVKTEAIVP